MASKMYNTPNAQSYIAAADLSAKQYTFVKFHTVLGEVAAVSSAADIPCGILMNAPTEGQAAEVAMPGGGALLTVDANIIHGSFISTGADGKGELATSSSGKYIGAIADAVSSSVSSADDVFPVNVTAFEAAREAQDIITTEGDVIQGGTSGVPERLAIGASGEVLTSNGTKTSWSASTYAEKAATLSVSKVQLLALNGAVGGDLEVVAAQAGVIYIPTSIQVFCDYDTAEYTAGDDLNLVLGTVASGTVVANIDKTAFIPGTTADSHDFMAMPDTALWASSATAVGVAITGLANKQLSLNIKSGGTQFTDPGTAAGVFQVKVTYREVALLA